MFNTEALTGMTLNDRYLVLDKIGTGGMAIVYKAHDNVLDRDVAIKVLRENYEIESTVVSNFIKEARSSASFVHPNVVSVYDVCECDGLNYMVMELVDGITLKEYIKKNPRLPWQEACDYAIQIGQGIQAAHERNIIHRDIKPQNIIVDSTGTLKVTDFGIAKAVEGDKSIAGGTAMGSVHYISPEQARGGFTDFRSDIYSMGVVLYEMLAGRVPFDGDTPVSVALKHIEEEALDVKCVNIDVPADLAYVTMKAMSREQGKRYQCMADFIEDLRAVLADEILPSKEKERILIAAQDEENDFDVDNDEGDYKYTDTDSRVRQKTKEKVMKKKSERKAILLALATTVAVALVILGVVIIFFNISSKTVPDLTGITLDEATKLANRYGYKISSEVEYSFSDDVAKDMVISQFPEAGVEAPKHEDIKIVISLGSTGGSVRVPNLINSRVDDAIAEIDNLNLIYNIIYDESNDVEMGNVIRQTPLEGTHVNEGDVVTIHISSGAALDETKIKDVKVPAVQMQALDAGRAIITANGLTVGMVTYEESETVEEGSIIEQNPAAGTTVQRGSVVTLVVSGGAPEDEESTEEPEETLSPTETEKPQLSGNVERYTVRIPDDAGETVHVKIVANGNVMHDSTHKKSEGVVVCEIVGNGTVRIQTYIDGVCVNDEKKTL